MANYGRLKTMKAAAIGTIIPWVGGSTEIPKGWLICDGSSISASKYPLLAQTIGNTYGGSTFTGNFPTYSGNITLPKIGTRPLVDMDLSYFGSGAIATKRETVDSTEALEIVGKFIGSTGGSSSISSVFTINGSTFTAVPAGGVALVANDTAPLSMVGTSSSRYQRSGAENKNPSITWVFNTSSFPSGVSISSYTIYLEDLSETVNGKNLVLWHLSGIPASTTNIPSNASSVPAGTSIRPNYIGSPGASGVSAVGYSGPQPPVGESHVYRLTISAILTGATASILTQSVQFKYTQTDANNLLVDPNGTATYPNNKNIVLGNTGSIAAAADIDNGPAINYDREVDILFEYATVETEFTGTITGAVLQGGDGQTNVYVAPRKLGRKHLQPHTHSGTYNSVSGLGETKPGAGVSCSREVTYQVESAGSDEAFGAAPQTQISVQAPSGNSNALGDGQSNVLLANISAEPSQLKPRGCTSHGVSRWFGNDTSISGTFGTPSNTLSQQAKLELNDDVPFGIGGKVYLENVNYDNGGAGSGDEHKPYKVSFNTSANDFTRLNTIGSNTTVIEPHNHGQFDVTYTNGNLRMPAIINVNAIADITPNNLPGALNINVAVTSPNLSVMYLIRAY